MKTLRVGETYRTIYGDQLLITSQEKSNAYNTSSALVYVGKCLTTGQYGTFNPNGKHISGYSPFNLIIPDEPEQTTSLTIEQIKEEPKVKNLEVILAIVQGTPVQYDYMLTGTWHDYEHNTGMSPVDHPEYNWRIKPQPEPKRTVQIGKRTVVAPEVNILHTGCEYFYIDRSQGKINLGVWSDHNVDKKRLELGNIFMLEQDAINCQEAISALLLGKD